MIHVLSKYGKSKKNCDVDLDENMISNIDTKKIDEIKNEENITKAQVDKNETNDQKIKNLIKQWLAKKFNKKNLTYYHENNIDWVDVENDSIFFKMIISHLKNFDKYDENGQSTIHRILLKWV